MIVHHHRFINQKAVSTYSLFLILLLLLILMLGWGVFKAWASTDRCLRLQSNCQGMRFYYCSIWVEKGELAEPTDKWPEDILTCTIEYGTSKKVETPCPKPRNFDECKLMIYGSLETTTTTI